MKKIMALGLALAMLAGCARNLEQDVYTSGNTVGKVVQGVIVSARPVTVKDQDDTSNAGVGALGGGVAGGVAGSAIGKGKGSALAAVGGAIAGAVIGAYAEDALSTQSGMEYVVKLAAPKAATADVSIKKNQREGGTPSGDINDALTVTPSEVEMISVVQADEQPMMVGQRVLVIYHDDRPRVVPDI